MTHGVDPKKLGKATIPIHIGTEGKDSLHNPVNVPIYASSTFAYPTVAEGAARFAGEKEGFIYTRIANPTTRDVEVRLAHLEETEDGILFGSGMAAVTTLVMTFVGAGDHMICDYTLYGGTHSLFTHLLPKYGVDVTFLDASNPDEVRAAIKENTKLIYVETPTNPTLRLVDLEVIGKIGQEKGIVTACDSTFMTPILMKPGDYGVDLTLHSATKYLNGHSDVVAGVVLGTKEHIDMVRQTAIHFGGKLGPFEAYLIGRGIKTLKLRMEKIEKNGRIIAEYLRDHPRIKSIIFPGFESHPQHELAKRQQKGFGSMMNFELDGTYDEACKFVNAMKLMTRAVSLGGVETLISHPASTTHAIMSPEDREKAGITDTLMRISVGIEDPEDLIWDLDQAFEVIAKEPIANLND